MQSQMIGLQSSLDRILTHLQNPPPVFPQTPSATFASTSGATYPTAAGTAASQTSADDIFFSPTQPPNPIVRTQSAQRRFPPLPGFAAPPHKYATYGIVPSTAPSSDDESEDTLPRATLNAPIEALQGLANAAAEAAAAPNDTPR